MMLILLTYIGDSDSERIKLSKLELVLGVGPFVTIARALLDRDNNLRVKFTQKQDKLYVAYLSAHVAALVYALAYSVSDGFTRDVPIYPFY